MTLANTLVFFFAVIVIVFLLESIVIQLVLAKSALTDLSMKIRFLR